MGRYNWTAWNSDIPGTIIDNFDTYRTDDTCPDVNDTTPPVDYSASKIAADLAARDSFRFNYYLPGSPEDLSIPRAVPTIESVNIVQTIQLTVYIRGRKANG